jgi:hypothetical protein
LFWANLTRLDDEALPPVGEVGPGGIVNGLYSIHIRALDGVDAGLSGVTCAMLAPFEPPIIGLRWRSRLVGVLSFACLGLMGSPRGGMRPAAWLELQGQRPAIDEGSCRAPGNCDHFL